MYAKLKGNVALWLLGFMIHLKVSKVSKQIKLNVTNLLNIAIYSVFKFSTIERVTRVLYKLASIRTKKLRTHKTRARCKQHPSEKNLITKSVLAGAKL